LFARALRILILRILSTTTREILHVLRYLTLARSRLCRTLAQIGDLLLASRCS
jgi:hypothetical protein